MQLGFLEARLLLEQLSQDQRRRLGVIDATDPCDFEIAEPSKKIGGEKVHYWVWTSAAVRKLQHEAHVRDEKRRTSLVPNRWGVQVLPC